MSLGTFCPLGRFVPWDVLSLGRYVPGMLCPLGCFVPGTFCLGTFCLRTFCLGTFCMCIISKAFITKNFFIDSQQTLFYAYTQNNSSYALVALQYFLFLIKQQCFHTVQESFLCRLQRRTLGRHLTACEPHCRCRCLPGEHHQHN